MAESTLSLTRNDLRNNVGFYLGFGADYTAYSTANLATVDRVIDAGLRGFYEPPPLPGEKVSHVWSFMTPIGSLSLAEDQPDYDLPDDFAGLTEGVYVSADDLTWTPVTVTSPSRILALRQNNGSDVSGSPQYVAVTVLPTTGVTPTRYSLMTWPAPDGSYTLKFPYRSNPYQLSSTIAYPLGGQPHAETLRESCLAAAERDVNDELGVHNSQFAVRLRASVNLDRQLNGTKHYGYNGDRRSRRFKISQLRHPSTQLVDYNGTIPG